MSNFKCHEQLADLKNFTSIIIKEKKSVSTNSLLLWWEGPLWNLVWRYSKEGGGSTGNSSRSI